MTTKQETVTTLVNNNLQDALATLINKTVAGVDAASGFLQEQIPDVIHQLLMWKMAEALFYVALLVVTLTVLITVFMKSLKKADWNKGNFASCLCVGSGISLLADGIISLVVIPSNLITALQIWIAPKVWLIEYAASLVKGS